MHRRLFATKVVSTVSHDLLLTTCMGHMIQGTTQKQLVQSLVNCKLLTNARVIQAMSTIDRADFTINSENPFQYAQKEAYENRPLPIGFGATISTPQHHAQMLQYMEPNLQYGHRALDIGCGTGYLTNVMAALVGESVFGLELFPELTKAAASIATSKYHGSFAACKSDQWIQDKSLYYDCIHVGFSIPTLSMATTLAKQLTPNGKLYVPIGLPSKEQELHEMNHKLESTVLMKTMCQDMQHEISTAPMQENPKQKLEIWKKQFIIKHNRSPNRQDIANNPEIAELFSQFSNARKRHWAL